MSTPAKRLWLWPVVAIPLLPIFGLVLGAPSTDGFLQQGLSLSTATLALRTFALAALVSAVAIGVGTWLAWAERRYAYRGARLLGVMTLLAMSMPSYVLAGTLRESLGPGGWVGNALGFGRFVGFGPAALTLSIATIPYVQLLVGAALDRLPVQEEEAARTLGMSRFEVFRRITLPRLRPSIAVSGLLSQLYVISDFGAVAMLDCPVLTYRLYLAVTNQALGEAVALSLGLLLLTVPLLVFARRLGGRPDGTPSAANPRPATRMPISVAARGAQYLLVGTIVFCGVLLPISTLLDWLSYPGGSPWTELGAPAIDTLRVALVGGLVTVLLSIGPAWSTTQSPRPRLELAVYLGSALPGVLLAFGLLLGAIASAKMLATFTPNQDASVIYQMLGASGFLLVFGYTARFFAEAFAALRSSLNHFDFRMIDASRVLGASPMKRYFRVILPSIAPGATVAFLLVAVAIAKELPVTLLLGGAMGIRTLSFRVFDRYQDAFMADAGAAALLLVVLAFFAFGLSLKWRRHV